MDTNKIPRYLIGVGGITDWEDTKVISKYFREARLERSLKPMISTPFSQESLKMTTTKNVDHIEKIIGPIEKGIGVIEYSTHHPESLYKQIIDFLKPLYRQKCVKGLKLDFKDARIDQIEMIKRSIPPLEVILSLEKGTIERVGKKEIMEKVQNYEGLISHLLVNAPNYRDNGPLYSLGIAEDISSKNPDLIVGFEGDFNHNNISEFLQWLEDSSKGKLFSIVGQGALIGETRGKQTRGIEKYIKKTSAFLNDLVKEKYKSFMKV